MNKKFLLVNWILVISYSCIIFFALYSSIYSWPTQGSVIWFLLIIFCPPFLYHCCFIGSALGLNKKLHWKKTYRLATFGFGILLAGGLLQLTQKVSLSRFKTAYTPLIMRVQQKMPQPCDSHYFEIPQVTAYNRTVTQKILHQNKPIARLLFDKQRFILQFRAGAVDVEGSSLVYDSQTQKWHFFHNRENQEVEKFAERIKGLTSCNDF